ncbi:MAG: peptidoglycan-binding domain-containing protein [Myxococcota bacterium]
MIRQPVIRIGHDADEDDDDPVVIPRPRIFPEEGTPAPPAESVDIGNRSITLNQQQDDGSVHGTQVSAGRDGATVQRSQHGTDGSESSASLGVNVEHRGDRITGGTVTGGVGVGRVSGSLSVGGSYWADPPRRAGARFVVPWNVMVRGGGEFGLRLLSAGFSVSGNGMIARSGTDIFPIEDGDVARAYADACQFQQSFETLDLHRLEVEIFDLSNQERGGLDWWVSERCPVGTQRTITVGGEVGGSLSVQVVQLGGNIRASGTGTVKKTAHHEQHQTFEVSVVYLCEREVSPGGDFMVGHRGGFGLWDNADIHREVHTYEVTTPAGSTAFHAHLAQQRVMNETMTGVTLKSHTVEDGDVQTEHTELLLAGFDGRSGVTTETSTNAAGEQRTLYRAYNEGSGSAVDGSYFRHNIQFEAPTGDEARYKFTLNHHDTEAGSSGNWVVVEEYSQGQIQLFHTRFLENYERSHPETVRGNPDTHPPAATVYDQTYRALSQIPTDASGNAQRAPIIAMLVSEDGERGYRTIRNLTGGPLVSSTRLFDEEGEDENFLQNTERDRLLGGFDADSQRSGGRIAEWEEQVAAAEARGQAVESSLIAAIEQQRDQLQQRRDALTDAGRYRDTPFSRASLLDEYDQIIARLDRLLHRAEHAGEENVHRDLSAEDFNRYQAVQQAEADCDRAQTRAQRTSQRALAVRNPNLESRTGARWAGAEERMQTGRTTRSEAQAVMARVRRQEAALSPTTRFSEAQDTFERATVAFRAAADIYDELLVTYSMARARREQPTESGTEPPPATTPAPDTQRIRRPSQETLHEVAQLTGFPEVDLDHALRRNGRLFERYPLMRRALSYGEPLPARLAVAPRWERRIQDALAVARYQRREGLEVDGIAGSQTRQRLLAGSEGDAEMQQVVSTADRERRPSPPQRSTETNHTQDESTPTTETSSTGIRRDVFDFVGVARQIQHEPRPEPVVGDTMFRVPYDRATYTHPSGLVTQLTSAHRVQQGDEANAQGLQHYVVGVRIVTPAPDCERFRIIAFYHPDRAALRVQLREEPVENQRGTQFHTAVAKRFSQGD